MSAVNQHDVMKAVIREIEDPNGGNVVMKWFRVLKMLKSIKGKEDVVVKFKVLVLKRLFQYRFPKKLNGIVNIGMVLGHSPSELAKCLLFAYINNINYGNTDNVPRIKEIRESLLSDALIKHVPKQYFASADKRIVAKIFVQGLHEHLPKDLLECVLEADAVEFLLIKQFALYLSNPNVYQPSNVPLMDDELVKAIFEKFSRVNYKATESFFHLLGHRVFL